VQAIRAFDKGEKTYPGSIPSPGVKKFDETAAPVPIHTKRIMATNSAASCLIVQSAIVAVMIDDFVE
jgi:hypothetical protein